MIEVQILKLRLGADGVGRRASLGYDTQRNASVRLLRDNVVIFEGKLSSLRRFKDDVKEVAQGYECGITLEKFSDLKNGDIFEAYEIREIKQ